MINTLKKIYNFIILLKVPKKIKNNFSDLSEVYKSLIEIELKNNYFSNFEKIQEIDMEDHITGRTLVSRTKIIPWLQKVADLKNKKILEIGCGTGSSSITFAEQGAKVTGIDVAEDSLQVAEKRAKLLDLDVKYKNLSGTEISSLKEQFD